VIRYESFAKRFGDHVAMDGLSLVVEAGTVVALLGPNGSGKTTSLKAAAGLIRPTSGRVLLGEPPVPAADPVARRLISFLPQKVSFPEALTGLEVAAFYGALREVPSTRVDEVLQYAGLNGAGQRAVGTYSGGMVQRLGLAMAMLPDAPVMLLDEPTAALDPDGLRAFYDLVERHRMEGRTVLFTSHQLGDVERLADRIAILVGGRLVEHLAEGELAQRLADRGLMRVRLGRRGADVLARVRVVAPLARWAGDELLVPGPSTSRMAVLEAIQSSGAEIASITAEEGRLDAFYRELVGEAS
jgi:Cu-processing system ATP-binding protein